MSATGPIVGVVLCALGAGLVISIVRRSDRNHDDEQWMFFGAYMAFGIGLVFIAFM